MKKTALHWSLLKGMLLLLAVVVITACGSDDNPLKDDSGTINPSSDRQKVIENISIDNAQFQAGALPDNSTDENAPVLSLNSVDVVGMRSSGEGSFGRPVQGVAASSMFSAEGISYGKGNSVQTEDNDHAIVRIRAGQTIKTTIFFTPSFQSVFLADVNVSILGASGFYTIGEDAFTSGSRCDLSIKTSQDFRPGTFQIIVNLTDRSGDEDVTSQNNVVIDVVVTGEPSDDASRLIVGTWVIKHQAPLPPYYPIDHRGGKITFRDNKTLSEYRPDGTEGTQANYEIRTINGITAVYPSNVRALVNGQWVPVEPAEYRIDGLNLTTMIFTEIEGLGRAAIFERQ